MFEKEVFFDALVFYYLLLSMSGYLRVNGASCDSDELCPWCWIENSVKSMRKRSGFMCSQSILLCLKVQFDVDERN